MMATVEGLARALYARYASFKLHPELYVWAEAEDLERDVFVDGVRAVLRALAPTIDPLLAACGECDGGGLVVDGPVDYGLTGNASRACPACGPIRVLMAEADNGS